MASSHRLRTGRHSEAGRIYMLTLTCYQRYPVFAEYERARIAVRELAALQPASPTHCFVVMPDHLHWLMQVNGTKSLSACVQTLKGNITRSLHKEGLFVGRVWQASFHDRAIRQDQNLRSVARYIVANPVRAGLVSSVRDYPWWDAQWL